MSRDYSDIIHLPHHDSPTHPRMSMRSRAAQFAPFAALNGHSEAISETARLTDTQIELSEYENERLNLAFERIQSSLIEFRRKRDKIEKLPLVKISFFVPDTKKEGGEYSSIVDRIVKIDEVQSLVHTSTGLIIRVPYIHSLELIEEE